MSEKTTVGDEGAYPYPESDLPGSYLPTPGMSYRQWFIGHAPDVPRTFSADDAARWAIDWADAVIERLSEGKT